MGKDLVTCFPVSDQLSQDVSSNSKQLQTLLLSTKSREALEQRCLCVCVHMCTCVSVCVCVCVCVKECISLFVIVIFTQCVGVATKVY